MNTKTRKRALFWVVFLTLVILFLFASWVTTIFTVARMTTSHEPVLVNIYTQHFSIPKNYFEFPYTKRDAEELALGIRVYYPDMNGATDETIKFERSHFGFENQIMIFLSARGDKKPEVGLYDTYTHDLNDKKYHSFKSETQKYGLHYFANTLEKSKIFDDDMYVDNLKAPTVLIRCTSMLLPDTSPTVKNASCKQYFQYKGIWYDLLYARKYQPEWQSINQKVKKLFDQFSVNPASN